MCAANTGRIFQSTPRDLFFVELQCLCHNIVTSVWHIYFCCTALCCLLLCFYSIVTHSKAGNCHFDVSGFYREAKYLHFLPIFDNLIKGTQRQLSAILRPKIENLDPFLVESSPISFFADCILSNTFTEHYCNNHKCISNTLKWYHHLLQLLARSLVGGPNPLPPTICQTLLAIEKEPLDGN